MMRPPRVTKAIGRLAIGVSLLLAASGLGLMARSAAPSRDEDDRWKGYRVLLVDASLGEADILSSLSKVGLRAVLSESTEPVVVSDWAGLETRTLAEADARLLPGDPRLDAYLQGLSRWFHGSVGGLPYRVYYIKSPPLFDQTARIERGLGAWPGRYLLPGTRVESGSGRSHPLFFFLFVAIILIACMARPARTRTTGKASRLSRGLSSLAPGGFRLDRLVFRLSLALPWAALAAGGLSAAAAATLWGLALTEAADSLEIPLEEFRRSRRMRKTFESLIRQGLPPLALPMVACLSLLAVPSLMPSAGFSLLGSLAALGGYALLVSRFDIRGRFVPIPIAARRRSAARGSEWTGRIRVALACATIVSWGLAREFPFSSAPFASSDSVYPLPSPERGSLRPLLVEARENASLEKGDALPGLASYLEHRAFQEALPYIRVGEARPDPFARVRMPLPSDDGAGDPSSQGVEFDDDWARAAYKAVPSLSIEGMLLSQGRAIVGREASVEGRIERPLASIEVLLYIFLLIPLLGRILVGVPFARDVASGELRQEA